MVKLIKNNQTYLGSLRSYISDTTFQRVLIVTITILASFIIIATGAAPKKYVLNPGDKSTFDITAPRDLVNIKRVDQKATAARDAVDPVIKEENSVLFEIFKTIDDFTTILDTSRKDLSKNGLQSESQEIANGKFTTEIKRLGIPLADEQIKYLLFKAVDEDIISLKKTTIEILNNVIKEGITKDNLASKIVKVQNDIQMVSLNQDMINIGSIMLKAVLKPNKTVDDELTEAHRKEAYKAAYDDAVKSEKIKKGERIVSVGDVVTDDKFQILTELNLLETTSRFDFGFLAGILVIILLLSFIVYVYMEHYNKVIMVNRGSLLLLCIIITFTLLVSVIVYQYVSPLAIPIFLAPMLVSILLDLKLAGIINFVLVVSLSLATKGDMRFIYIGLITGTLSAFLVSKANQRSKLSAVGLVVGLINVLIVVCMGIINKSGFMSIANESMIVFINGIVSVVLTIGLLPTLESLFNIITPLKLLELANPNQPLIKRLLIEAPGTYHHSLMVGNLSEIATEAIGGNALLARVGAYFHDIGKLKRPVFFKENQMSENPHDRMTANLSVLVITSHTHDGVDIARRYNIPLAIKEIISQHHGTTLVAYFYHKAKKGSKGDLVKQENFRYGGPKPTSKEAAVVMLADSVEAAVRSMVDKTEGKIEGLVRKIIKDKLDDGQLNLCELTLKDFDTIAKSFMRVFSGFFHEREQYPETKSGPREIDITKVIDPLEEEIENKINGKVVNGDIN